MQSPRPQSGKEQYLIAPRRIETGVLDHQQILDLYAEASEVPSYLTDLFGAEQVEALRRVMETPSLLEMDFLLLDGTLAVDELGEYAFGIPESRAAMRDLRALGSQLILDLAASSAYERALEKTFNKRGRASGMGVLKLLQRCEELRASFLVPNRVTFRSVLSFMLAQQLRDGLLGRVWLDLKLGDAPERWDELVRYSDATYPSTHPLRRLRSMGARLEMLTVALGPTREVLDQLVIPEETQPLAEQHAELTADVDRMMDLVAQGVLAPPALLEPSPALAVLLTPASLFDQTSVHLLQQRPADCAITLTDPVTAQLRQRCAPDELSAEQRYELCELTLDRLTGDLLPHQTGIPLSTLLEPDHDLVLRRLVVRGMLEQLQRAAATVPDEYGWRYRAEQAQARAALAGAVPEAVAPAELAPPAPPQQLRLYSCREVLAACENLGLELVRIRGSHHIYRGPNGGSYPIPLHFSEDADPCILRSFIRRWGISPAQFDAAVRGRSS